MGIRNPVPLSPPPPSQRQRSEQRGKRSRDHNKFRPVGCWDSHSMPRAQRSVRTPPPFAEPLPRGGTEPAPYRPTESPLNSNPPVYCTSPCAHQLRGGIPMGGACGPSSLRSFQGGRQGGNIGLPPQSKRSVCGGKRRSSGMSEPVPEGKGLPAQTNEVFAPGRGAAME